MMTNVESNFWIKLLKTFDDCVNYSQMIFTEHRGGGCISGGSRGCRLFRSRLRTQLNIPAPLHRGCAGVEQPLYPAEPTPPKILKYIIVMRPRGAQTWLVDIFFSLHKYRQTDWQSISHGNRNCWVDLKSLRPWCCPACHYNHSTHLILSQSL